MLIGISELKNLIERFKVQRSGLEKLKKLALM